jgi:hypothetical protein
MLTRLTTLLIAGCALVGQAHADNCPIRAEAATASEINLLGAVTRVFAARWLPRSGGIGVAVGLDCVDLSTTDGGRYKLYRVLGTDATYNLDTLSGENLGQISFNKLSDMWQTAEYGNVQFKGLPGAVCDGSAAPHEGHAFPSTVYSPGRCWNGYINAIGADSEAVRRALNYIFANLCSPAELRQNF